MSNIVRDHYGLSASEEFFFNLTQKAAPATGAPMPPVPVVIDPMTLIPLDVLGVDAWTDPQGISHIGGLYPFGQNTPPAGHNKLICQANKNVYPRNGAGVRDDISGKIGFMVIGASNPMHIANIAEDMYYSDPQHNPKVVIVNNGQEGMSVDKMLTTSYFSGCLTNVAEHGLTAAQVQCVWFKTDTLEMDLDDLSFDDYVDAHMPAFCDALQRILIDYPNCKIIYFTGRHTTRYALAGYEKHFEPRAYYCNWIHKFLIEEQINGNPNYKCKGIGAVMPVLAWANPFYSNGPEENTFGYSVNESTFIPAGDGAINNGVHLSDAGLEYAADYFLDFFFTNPYTKKWFKS